MMHKNSWKHLWVKIWWWHALRLASAFPSSYRTGIPFTTEIVLSLELWIIHWLLASLRTTHWPSKSDLLTLINDQCLMLSCHWRGRSSNGHSLVNYWNYIHSLVEPIVIIIQRISCNNLHELYILWYDVTQLYLHKIACCGRINDWGFTLWKPQIFHRIWILVSSWHVVHSIPGE